MYPGTTILNAQISTRAYCDSKKVYYVRTPARTHPLLNINSQSQMSLQTKVLRTLASAWQHNRVTKWNNSVSIGNYHCGFTTSKYLTGPSFGHHTHFLYKCQVVLLFRHRHPITTTFRLAVFGCLPFMLLLLSLSLLGETLGDYFKWSQRLFLAERQKELQRRK